MSSFIVEDVPNGQIKSFCRLHRVNGATKCEPTDNGDGTSDVSLEYPDVEKFDSRTARLNR